MKLYKLTNQKMETRENFKWKLNKKFSLPKKDNPQLCTSDVFHVYKTLNLGLLLNPVHARIENPRIFECVGDVVVEDWDEVGCFELTLNSEIPYPGWYQNNEIRSLVAVQFAVLCADSVIHYWTNKYPNYKKPQVAIRKAKRFLDIADIAAADAAYAAYAADAAVYADAAADAADIAAADAAYAAYAAYAAVYADAAADAADIAAADAAYAAYAAADAVHAKKIKIDFAALADKAVKLIMREKNI